MANNIFAQQIADLFLVVLKIWIDPDIFEIK